VSPEVARQVIGLLIDALQAEAKNHLPSYVQDSWLVAMSSVLEGGLFHVWQSLLENIDTVKLEAEVVEIIDSREDGNG
jgi:hypothetical protein